MSGKSSLLFVIISVVLCACSVTQQPGRFSQQGISKWQHKVFAGATQYRLVEQQQRMVLEAHSQQTASVLYRRSSIDLEKTPYLSWQWKVSNSLGVIDEQAKVGDDYPARVYVLLSSASLGFTPRALCYVWSSNTPAGGHWVSPYSEDVIIVNLRNGEKQAGRWLTEKRNVREDIKQYFGEDILQAEGLAIMTDTDNSQSTVTSYYSDLLFSAD